MDKFFKKYPNLTKKLYNRAIHFFDKNHFVNEKNGLIDWS